MRRLVLFWPLLICLVVIGCSKKTDVTDSNPNPPVVAGCKDCEYYPICDGSYFTFIDSLYPGAPVLYTDTFKLMADTTINNLIYKTVKRVSSKRPSTEYVNCKNGIYRVAGKYGFGPVPLILLKPNEPVGTIWTEYPFSDVKVTMTIVAKGLSMQINNTTYTDIIKEKFLIEGRGSIYTAYYYFAKGVGIIKFEYGEWNFNASWYHRNYLQSYFIP